MALSNLLAGFNPKLTKAAKDDPGFPVLPEDRVGPVPVSPSKETDLCNYVLENFKRSAESRWVHELDWLKCVAYKEGNQWVSFRAGTNRMLEISDPDDPYRQFLSVNIVRRLMRVIKTRMTATQPDVDITPATMRPVDVGGAAEMRDIKSHIDLKDDIKEQIRDAVDSAATMSTTFWKAMWNPTAEALVWNTDDQGEMQAQAAKVGEIETCIVPSPEIYIDPDARSWDAVQWVLHVKRRPLEYFKEKFGARGALVQVDDGIDESYAGYLDLRFDTITGDSYRARDTGDRHSAYLYEYWEKPSEKFPDGRYIPVGGRVLLKDPKDLGWPYKKLIEKKMLPFVPFTMEKRFHSVWGLNFVHDLLDPQTQYNNLLARTNDQINAERVIVATSSMSHISTDSLHLQANYANVVYDGPYKPEIIPPPPVGADRFEMLQQLEALMEDLSGVHDPSQGQSIGALSSGTALESLQESDRQTTAEAHGNLESAMQMRTHLLFLLASEFYTEPRLLAVSSESDTGKAMANAHDFRHLQAGGQVRCKVVPGSSLPKSTAAREQKILDLAKAGMLQPPNLPTLVLLLELLNIDRSDEFDDKVQALIQQNIQMQQQAMQQPQAMAQQEQEMAAAAQLQKQQNDMQLKQADTQGKVQVEQVKQAGQAQLLGLENSYETQMAAYEAQQAELTRRSPQVTLSLAGKADPTAIVSGERSMGLDAGSVEEAKDANAPPPMAPKGGLGGNSKSAANSKP